MFCWVWDDFHHSQNPPSSKPWAIAQALRSKSADFGPLGILLKSFEQSRKHLGGVYMIPVWLSFRYEIYFRTTFTLKCRCLLYRNDSMWAPVVTCCFLINTHALLVPVNSVTHFIPVRNVVSLHTGTKLSYRYKNRSELVPVWLVPVRHFVPVSCKQIQSHKWEPGWTRTGMKVIPVSCKHPLRKPFAIMLAAIQTIQRFRALTNIRHRQKHGQKPRLFAPNRPISDPWEFSWNLLEQSRKHLGLFCEACGGVFVGSSGRFPALTKIRRLQNHGL